MMVERTAPPAAVAAAAAAAAAVAAAAVPLLLYCRNVNDTHIPLLAAVDIPGTYELTYLVLYWYQYTAALVPRIFCKGTSRRLAHNNFTRRTSCVRIEIFFA